MECGGSRRGRTGPEKENEKLVSATHSAAGFRHGAAAAGSLGRGNEVDEAHSGSCALKAMFSAQLVPSPVDRETEEQVVMRRSMAPSRSGGGEISLMTTIRQQIEVPMSLKTTD